MTVDVNYLCEVPQTLAMERNYDEIISEMLIQIDRHTEELTKYSQELTAVRMEQGQINKAMLSKLEAMEKIDNQHLEQLVHSATILDRIIRKNDLRV